MSASFQNTKAKLEGILSAYRQIEMPTEAPNSPVAARFDSPLGFEVSPEEIVIEVDELDSKPMPKTIPKPITKASNLTVEKRSIITQAWIYPHLRFHAELLEFDVTKPKRKPMVRSNSCPNLVQLREPVAKGPKIRI